MHIFLLVVLPDTQLYYNLYHQIKRMHYDIFDVTVDNEACDDVACSQNGS